MISILRAWGKGAHSQSLSTKEQAMVAAKSTDEFELSDAQLEVAYGGCDQSGDERNSQGQSYGGYDPEGNYRHHHGHNQHYGYGGYGRHHHHHPNGYNGYNGYGNTSQEQSQPDSWQC